MNHHKVLISGGTGFVGSNIVRRLVGYGWLVHVIISRESDTNPLGDITDRITLHIHDGSTQGMHDIIVSAQPDLVLHIASLFLSNHAMSDVSALCKSNILFGTQLLEAMGAQSISKFLNVGTSWQHYNNENYSPVNLYAATKQAFEDILEYYIVAKGIDSITLKLFDTYGPNDKRKKLFHLLENSVREGKVLAMSPGEQLIDLVYIDDVVDAFVIAAHRLLGGYVKGHECYAVSSGKPIKLREVVDLYERIICRKMTILWGHRPYRQREVMTPWSKGTVLPGWQPKIELEDGIKLIASRT